VTDDSPGQGPNGEGHPPARRPPRPFVVHWAVDTSIALLVVLFPVLLLGLQLVPWVIAAAVVGLIAAPWTLRMEAEALARRPPPDEHVP
jgi:hypothetical protein